MAQDSASGRDQGLIAGLPLGQPLFSPDRRDDELRDRLLGRVRSEFSEMPCLRLTLPQSARLFGMTHEVCARVLGTLVREGTLWQDPDGRYGTRVNH
jgi:hypothetical protein